MDENQAKQLRAAFPKESIGRLPKGGTMLDYVGHAAVTDRLLTVDPSWTWEPLALDDQGLPAIDQAGNLWIRMTVCGVTRIGVGDGKNMKERIGDAIRNAAMRFGVALDLWSKEELSGGQDQQPPRPGQQAPADQPSPGALAIAKTRAWDLTKARGDQDQRKAFLNAALQARGSSIETATADDYTALADEWEAA